MDNLFDYLIENEKIKKLFQDVANMYMAVDLQLGFAFLLSYTHFKDFHEFIVEYHKTGKVNDEKLNCLQQNKILWFIIWHQQKIKIL